MNPFISQLMEFVPERTPRTLYGAQFESADKTACKHPERFAFVAAQLDWLTPLRVLTREEQVFLGLRSAGGRPQQDADMDMDEEEAAGEEIFEMEDSFAEVGQSSPRPEAENPLMMPG